MFSEVFDLKRPELVTSRDSLLEMIRIVPEGHGRLARRGGFVVNIESEPQPGLRKSRDCHSVAPPGARRICCS